MSYPEATFLHLPGLVLQHGWAEPGAQADALERIEEEARTPGTALRQMVALLGREGVLRLMTDEALGGRFEQTSFRAIALARERLGQLSPLADLALTMQGLGSFPITLAARKHGQPNAAELLAPIVAGEQVAAFALTEPEAGTDLSRIASRATRDGDDYLLEGEKVYISNAPIADRFTFFAKSGDEGKLSCFVVDRSDEGVEAEPMAVIGGHPIGRLRLDAVRVPASRRLGPEGKGMALALGTLGSFRPTVGAAAIGFAQRALDEAVAHTRSREQFDGPLAQLPQVQARLGRMACAIDGARLLVQRAAAAIDAGEDRRAVAHKGSMAKYVATEAAQEVVDSAVQLHGGLGVEERSVVARLYQDVRSLRIYEGTNDVHEILIARELLR
jgi:acyl-CoA dehydrogenase